MTVDRDILVDYVMGSLTPEQETEVAGYLNRHPEDAAWVRDLFETLAAVALAQDPAEVPAGAEDALLRRVRAGDNPPVTAPAPVLTLPKEASTQAVPAERETAPRRSRRNAWVGLALAAAIAVVAWVGLRPTLETYQTAQRLERLCGEPGVSCETLSDDANRPLGTLALSDDNEVFVVFDQAPPAGQVYQAWEIVGGTPQSLGIWTGRVLDVGQALGAESVFGVSVEPPGGSPQPTSTPIVVVPLKG